jgi:mannosyl-3-phosphoglycerate phosphatase family protein
MFDRFDTAQVTLAGMLSPLVFSDIDGTLLDPDQGGFAPARELLEQLKQLGIPVVLATSRTIDQTTDLRRAMGNRHPFIIENGGGVCIPDDYFPEIPGEPTKDGLRLQVLGLERSVILQRLEKLKERFDFHNLADLDNSQLQRITSLSAAELRAARARAASEWVLWRSGEQALQNFRQHLERAGLRAVQSGQFLHVTGETDKARAMAVLRASYQRHVGGQRLTVIALGDGPNDLEMLRTADIGIVLPRADGSYVAPETAPDLRHAEQPGPAGWRDAMLEIIQELAATN